MKDIKINYDNITVVAAKYGYLPTDRKGFYANNGIEVDLSAAHPDFVDKIIIEQLTKELNLSIVGHDF